MRRTLLAVAFAASLLTSGSGPLDPLWDLFSSLWGGSAGTDAGCGWDPDGRCLPAPEPQTDEGCGWDPYGCPKGS